MLSSSTLASMAVGTTPWRRLCVSLCLLAILRLLRAQKECLLAKDSLNCQAVLCVGCIDVTYSPLFPPQHIVLTLALSTSSLRSILLVFFTSMAARSDWASLAYTYLLLFLFFYKLFQKKIQIRERPLNKHSLDSSDVFILDLGLEIYQVAPHPPSCPTTPLHDSFAV